MTGCLVAVKVQRAAGLEDSMEFDEAWGHHCEVGEQVVSSEEVAECLHHDRHATTTFDSLFVRCGGGLIPFPGVLEGFELGGGVRSVLFFEQNVVVLVALE